MCEQCYIDAGSPSIINEKTEHAARLIESIYDSPEGGVGGYAHIIVDDWNLDDDSIDFCLNEAILKN
jgi:hypothetical protein